MVAKTTRRVKKAKAGSTTVVEPTPRWMGPVDLSTGFLSQRLNVLRIKTLR